ENTLVAFKRAIDLGATMLELDVHQTNDSHLVVIHDETVDRTTNGDGKIKDLSLAQIKLLDAGSWFSPEYAGEKIPTLGEVFDITPDSISLLIELKEGSIEYPGIEERVARLIRERDAQHRVILKSFDDDILKRLRKLAPDVRRLKVFVTQISFLGIIIERGLNFGTVLNDSVQYVQHYWFGLTQSFIDEAHRKGYKVFAWDVNDRDRMKDLVEIGIDGIETDHPDWVKELLH
ncbi:MAG TPA: glycerophosphodiester phosphodiesterase family protein, partial [Bacteroidota bacterium]|nr:glycerophosphodiester phosphodiesterase family protein [Bacteroidota bacterium]